MEARREGNADNDRGGAMSIQWVYCLLMAMWMVSNLAVEKYAQVTRRKPATRPMPNLRGSTRLKLLTSLPSWPPPT
uniref:Uncharacterized protein n=1 Tax=Arundo donax TaxID=35708 RepID=A0A0A9CJH0_ARUDO